MKKILKYINSELKAKILVVGDLILDKYYFGNVERISPEAPVPVVHVKKIVSRIGGAGNTALNLKNLGVNVDILGIVGNDENAIELLELIEKNGFKNDFIFKVENITTTKIRVISRQQHLIRIDFEEVKPISIEDKILKLLEEHLKNYDIVIISDYNKGLITENISQYIINSSKFTIVDPKGKNWKKYKNANIITPNVKELSEGLNLTLENEDKQLEIAGKTAIERYNINSILITRSEKGLSYIDRQRTIHVPTIESEVYDVSGAGDTVVASLAFGILCNIDMKEILEFANLCASIVIRHIGTYAIKKEDILNFAL
ncbi:MAG: PfkB family carbohydrate kinase [candidate division WOR-3 bacterium]|nr:PfkB family carbohydrate kinase [candidate division WOR-3 bacterium]MCX7948124.1 PfkB family carbohydrate kinase [candidate division WOR-3 bacterium]MDW8150798.1 PfkB family carbohydrate kinase [candidate division WOR-3 bacterium]